MSATGRAQAVTSLCDERIVLFNERSVLVDERTVLCHARVVLCYARIPLCGKRAVVCYTLIVPSNERAVFYNTCIVLCSGRSAMRDRLDRTGLSCSVMTRISSSRSVSRPWSCRDEDEDSPDFFCGAAAAGSTFFARCSPKVLKICPGLLLYQTKPQKGSDGKIKCKSSGSLDSQSWILVT